MNRNILISTTLLLLTCIMPLRASAQQMSILVQPISIEVQPKPGESVRVPVQVRNTSATDGMAVDVRLWPLHQAPDGKFNVFDPETNQNIPPAPGQSCLSFTRIDTELLEVPAASARFVNVDIAMPSNARGFYAGVLIVQTRPPRVAGQIAIRLRFLVPIFVSTYGQTLQRRVEVKEPNLHLAEASEKNPRGTRLLLVVKNAGAGLARIRSECDVYGKVGTNWRRVCRVDLPERRLLPGVEALLSEFFARRLPRGSYKISTRTYIDGMLVNTTNREIEYEGDPEVDSFDTEVEILVDPARATITGSPGAIRTVTLTITNKGEAAATIRYVSQKPRQLDGVALGERTGDMIDSSGWTECEGVLTVPAGQQRRVRATLKFPSDLRFSHYFSEILFTAVGASGERVGTARTVLIAENKGVRPLLEVQPSGRMSVVSGSESRVTFTGRFANTGSAPIELLLKKQLLDTSGMEVLVEDLAAGKEMVLPFQTVVLNMEMDLSKVKPGYYVVRFTATGLPIPVVLSSPIRVFERGGTKHVELVGQKMGPGKEKLDHSRKVGSPRT
jgi:hypothetical protein